MLRSNAMAGTAEQYYTSLQTGKEDYYLDAPGIWAGKGAPKLGLKGEVTKDAHHALFQGFDPKDPQRKLVQNAGKMTPYGPGESGAEGKRGRKPGWDMTASAEKSFSVVYALADRAERARLREDLLFAAGEVVSYMEERSVTRTGKGGAKEERAELVAALVPHTTARPVGRNVPDPQCHVHILFYNVGVSPREKTPDGHPKTRSLRSEHFYELQREGDRVFTQALASRIEERYELEKGDHGWRVKGVPQALCEEFSKRSRLQVERVAPRGTPAWEREKAAKATRSPKKKFTSHEVDASWEAAATEHGFTRDAARGLIKPKEASVSRDGKRPEAPSTDERAPGEKKPPGALEIVQPQEKPAEATRAEAPKPFIVTEPKGVYSASKKREDYFTQGYVEEEKEKKPGPRTQKERDLDKELVRQYVRNLEKREKVLGVTWRSSDAERVEREIGLPALSVHRSLRNLEENTAPSALDVLRAHWRYATWQSTARERDSVIREREKSTRYEFSRGTTVLFIGEKSDSLEFKDFQKEAKRYGARVVMSEDLLPKLRAEEQSRRADEVMRREFSEKAQKREAPKEQSKEAPQKPQSQERSRERVRERDLP